LPTDRSPQIAGALAGRPGAAELGLASADLLGRYVREVVVAFRLCPFLAQPESALGAVIVVLDPEPVEATLEAIVADGGAPVMHVLYPLLAASPSPPFERFASRVGTLLRQRLGRAAPVSAAFHPAMHGETDDPHRLIGLLRRAPHPFVQYVPSDVPTGGGTVVAGAPLPPKGGAEANFERLTGAGGDLARLLERIAALHRERDERVAPLAARLLAA
jgi:hypothetical protein